MSKLSDLISSSISGATGPTGATGLTGPSTAVNATNDTTTVTLYPVMVGAAGSDQTPKVRTTATALEYNANTGTLSAAQFSGGGVSLTALNASQITSGTLAISNGGTGANTRQNAMDALAGAVTSGSYLRGNGTDVVMSAIQAADVPTLNQSTTGSAATLTTGRTLAITGDLAYTSPSFNGSGNVTAAGTLATVNANVGSFTFASITVNAKGLITAASSGTVPAEIPSGSVMLFYQAAAPTGWTQVTAQNNKALRVVSGTGGGTGGSVAFTTAFASQAVSGTVGTSGSTTATGTVATSTNNTTATGTVATSTNNTTATGSVGTSGSTTATGTVGTSGATTLTITQIPAHNHEPIVIYEGTSPTTGGASLYYSRRSDLTYQPLGPTSNGGSGSHTHAGGTFTGTSHNHSGGTFTGTAHNHTATSTFTGTAHNHTATSTFTGTAHTHTQNAHNHTATSTFTGTAHNHTATSTFTGTAHTHTGGTFTGTAINLAVQYIDVILCSKN
jgi:hypothetical protein